MTNFRFSCDSIEYTSIDEIRLTYLSQIVNLNLSNIMILDKFKLILDKFKFTI